MPEISVIIPTWNRAVEVQRAVKSVLNQTCQDFEILVADDGSTDNTPELFENYPDKRVRYLRLEHSGLPAIARNAAIKLALGEWVAFLDSDDEWLPQKIQKQVEVTHCDPHVDLVCSNAYRYFKNDDKRSLFFSSPPSTEKPLIALLKYSNFVINSSALVRKELLLSVDGLSEDANLKGIEDFDLWLRIALLDCSIHYIHQPLVIYYDSSVNGLRSEMAGQSYLKGMLLNYENIFNQIYRQNKLSPDLERILIERIYSLRRQLGDWGHEVRDDEEKATFPELSVILPVFNGEDYILESIYSVLTQTFSNFELIVINDGSTDKTAELISNLKDPRLRLIHQDNRGLVYSLNLGLSLACGKYIARQDHDDIAFPTRFEKQVSYFKNHPECGLLGTRANIWVGNKTTSRQFLHPVDNLSLKFFLLFDNPFVHSSVMFRREVLEQLDGYNSLYAHSAMEDYEFWTRISQKFGIANLSDVLQIYREVPTSISRNQLVSFSIRQKIMAEQLSQIENVLNHEAIIRQLLALFFRNKKEFERDIPFKECRSILLRYSDYLVKKDGYATKQFGQLVDSLIHRLARAYYDYKLPPYAIMLFKLDYFTRGKSTDFLEFLETKTPFFFSTMALCLLNADKTLHSVYRTLKHTINK
jgi:glycosyltransferase involved in cell wall biosynthesis